MTAEADTTTHCLQDAETPPAVQDQRTCLLVLGMHRSGTSALAGTLAMLGAAEPATEMPTDTTNAKGFFESWPVAKLHDELLESVRTHWSDWRSFNESWFGSDRAAEYRGRMVHLLRSEFGDADLFVLKDPRICRLLPFWQQVLHDLNCRPLVIHSHRNPLDVAASLEKRDGFPLRFGEFIWLRHVLDAEYGTRGWPRCFTSYDRLLEDWRREVAHIGQALGLEFPNTADSIAEEMGSFLSGDLKHFDHGARQLPDQLSAPIWTRVCYGILERWTREGEDPQDFATLDRINREFSVVKETFT